MGSPAPSAPLTYPLPFKAHIIGTGQREVAHLCIQQIPVDCSGLSHKQDNHGFRPGRAYRYQIWKHLKSVCTF